MLSAALQIQDQVDDQRGPPGLVRGAQPGAGVAVEVLVERQQVVPGRVALEQLARRRSTGRRPSGRRAGTA